MDVLYYVLVSIPMISSLTFGMIFTFAFEGQLIQKENKLRKYLAIYFITASIIWLNVQLSPTFKEILKYFIPLTAFLVLVHQISFYQFFCTITPMKNEKNNYRIHYFIAFLLFLVLLLSMLNFILIPSLSEADIPNFFANHIYYYSLLSGIFYSYTEIKRLQKFRKVINDKNEWDHHFKWLETIMFMSIAFIVLLILVKLIHPLLTIFMVIIVPINHTIIVYNVLNRNGIILPRPSSAPLKGNILTATGDIISSKESIIIPKTQTESILQRKNILEQSSLEAYFEKEKPYLNPNLQLNDIAERFNTNRTYVSKFINTTYQQNASQYINEWRLKEVLQLKEKEENKTKKLEEIVVMAGFNSIRNYLRTKNKTNDSSR